MQNVKILINTDIPFAAPVVAEELKIPFTTVPRLVEKGRVFSFPTYGIDYLHNSGSPEPEVKK